MVARRTLLKGLGLLGLGGAGAVAATHPRQLKSWAKAARDAARAPFAALPDFAPLRPIPAPSEQAAGFRAPPIAHVRVGLIGVGNRGSLLARLVAGVPGASLVAVCDLQPERGAELRDWFTAKGLPAPDVVPAPTEDSYQDLLARGDIDLVLIATPWPAHAGMIVAAMAAGVHVGCELHLATTMEDCWRVLEAVEAAKRHCMILENACYGYSEQVVYNLARRGVLGEIVHAQGAYVHDLIESTLDPSRHNPPFWRLEQHKLRNGCLYPSHGFGPVSKALGLLETDTATGIISLSGPAVGYELYSKGSQSGVKQGDVNVSLIRLESGRLVQMQFSTSSPRPYSRDATLVGTKGTFSGFPDRIALFPNGDTYDDRLWQAVAKRYESGLWSQLGATAREQFVAGHGGMDYLMMFNLIANLRAGRAMDISLYESLMWSAIAPASEASVAAGGQMIPLPDFSRGAWRTRGEVAPPFGWAPLADLGFDPNQGGAT